MSTLPVIPASNPPPAAKASALATMAQRYSVEPSKLLDTLKSTVFQNATNEELLALVVVANEYGLNPFTREIYAFPKKGGGIQPVVSVDGWIRMMNAAPGFDGIEFAFRDDGDPSVTATIHVKGRAKPTSVTEYLSECQRNTEPWKIAPRRMLRHRALVQCARVAFGFGSFVDPEDAAIMQGQEPSVIVSPPSEKPAVVTEQPPTSMLCTPREPRDELATLVIEAGFTFDDLKRWAIETGNIAEADSLGGFDDVPPAVATRLLRAKSGLIQALTLAKGGGK